MAGESGVPLLRRQAIEIFQAGLEAADPASAVRRSLELSGGLLEVAGRPIPGPLRGIRVVAFGKAACAMASAVEKVLPAALFPGPGIAVTSYGSSRPLERFQVIEAGHPLPDANGLRGSRAIAGVLSGAREDELALVLISGGGSALLPSPAQGLTLEDEIEITRLLLASGAPIDELNAVRKHLSTMKGGGMARIIAPARSHALILSDCIGDDPSVIASGPLSPDPTTFEDAIEILRRRGVLERSSPAVRERLLRGARGEIPETPKPGDPLFEKTECAIVGSNRLSLSSARERALQLGYRARILSDALAGEARDAAARLAQDARASLAQMGSPDRVALLSGGETTVTVRGRGRGGRNQEMALAFALLMEDLRPAASFAFLSAGTDGVDGPTDAAGAVVDAGTPERVRRKGIDPRAALDENDSFTALAAAGDLYRTGPTGTNVADLQVLLLERSTL